MADLTEAAHHQRLAREARRDAEACKRQAQAAIRERDEARAEAYAMVAAKLTEAAALAESAMRCRSCGGVFAAKNLHTDETCPKSYSNWDSAEPDEVAAAILALIDAPADAALTKMLAEAEAKGMEEAAGIADWSEDEERPWESWGMHSNLVAAQTAATGIAATIRARAAEVREGGA